MDYEIEAKASRTLLQAGSQEVASTPTNVSVALLPQGVWLVGPSSQCI